MGSVTTVVVSMLLLIGFLDSPFHEGVGGVRPVAMERTLRIIDEALQAVGAHASGCPVTLAGFPSSMTGAHEAGLGRGRAPRSCSRCAAVATAWSSYQANRWNGEQAKASARVNKTRIEAARASGLANAQQQVDVATFMAWVDSYARGETELVTFYRTRFRAGVQAGVRRVDRDEAAQDQGRPADAVRDAASTGWRPRRRPTGSTQTAEALAAEVRQNIQRSSNYVLGVVLFAVALFFAGMSTKLTAAGPRKAMVVIGCVLFVGTVIWIATFPVSVAV